MGLIKRKTVKVSKGQIAPDLIERTEIGILDISCQEMTNWINTKYGAIKTVDGSDLKYTFGANKKIKILKVTLQDNTEGLIALNGTDSEITVFNYKGELVSNVYQTNLLTETNVFNAKIAQNQDLILLCLGNQPIIKIDLTLPNITGSVFAIPANKILKASNISYPYLQPILYRYNTSLPSDARTENLQVGNMVYPNSATGNPNTTFPWKVKRLLEVADSTKWRIVTAKIANVGSGYQVNDKVTLANGATFTITELSAGATLTIDEPDKVYDVDPAGTGTAVSSTTGSGSGMTVTTTSENLKDKWNDEDYTAEEGDVIKDKWDDSVWEFQNNNWTKPEQNTEDRHYDSSWTINATQGVVKVTGSGTLLSLDAPVGVDPEVYAKAILCGVKFDGENDGIGVMTITDLTGSKNGQRFDVKTLTGVVSVTFDKEGTKKGFTIKFSQKKVFDGDFPGTNNNPTQSTNYPQDILFYQQRLIIAGSVGNKAQLVFSQLGIFDDFTDEGLADSAFQLVIGSTEKEEIRSVLVNQGVQIFTSNNEWLINDTSITKSSGFTRNSSIGTNGVKPIISANGTTLFPPKNGKGIIGFTYNYETASFSTPYISLFTNLLDYPIVDMALKKSSDSTDDVLLFICNDRGEMIIGNYLQEHDIQAFGARKATGTLFKQTLQCEENVLILSDRNGVTSLEIINPDRHTSVSQTNVDYSPETGIINITGAQYNGQDIAVYNENGEYVGSYKVIDNKVTIPEEERPQSISEFGYPIESRLESNPLNIGNDTKTVYKTLNEIKLVVTPESNTDYLTVCGKKGRRIGDLVIFTRPTRPLRDCRYVIENKYNKVTILSIEMDLES